MKRITVGEIVATWFIKIILQVKREQFSSGWDEEFQCMIVDEDAEDQVSILNVW